MNIINKFKKKPLLLIPLVWGLFLLFIIGSSFINVIIQLVQKTNPQEEIMIQNLLFPVALFLLPIMISVLIYLVALIKNNTFSKKITIGTSIAQILAVVFAIIMIIIDQKETPLFITSIKQLMAVIVSINFLNIFILFKTPLTSEKEKLTTLQKIIGYTCVVFNVIVHTSTIMFVTLFINRD